MKRIGALWNKTGKNKDGSVKKFQSGVLEVVAGIKTPVVIFVNDKKEKANDPDKIIYLVEEQKPKPVVPQRPAYSEEDFE